LGFIQVKLGGDSLNKKEDKTSLFVSAISTAEPTFQGSNYDELRIKDHFSIDLTGGIQLQQLWRRRVIISIKIVICLLNIELDLVRKSHFVDLSMMSQMQETSQLLSPTAFNKIAFI
jgi:hypothetical protein